MFSILFALKGSFYMQVIYRGLDVVFICGIFKFNIFFGWCDTLHQSWLVRSLFQGLVLGVFMHYTVIINLLQHLTYWNTSHVSKLHVMQHLVYCNTSCTVVQHFANPQHLMYCNTACFTKPHFSELKVCDQIITILWNILECYKQDYVSTF